MDAEVTRLVEQYKDVIRRVEKVESLTEYQQRDIQKVLESQAATKMQVELILSRIDKLEANVLAPLRTVVDSLRAMQTGNSDTCEQSRQKMWMDLFKWVLGGTIVALVAWFVTQGG